MKILNRLYIHNWHKIKKQMIPFAMMNFMTGKNTAGKSTIIDALQFIFLGDKSGHYFNRAANEKSVRTLKSYLFSQSGYSDEKLDYVYDRENKTFNTYLLAEFYNQKTKKYFTIGAVFDCYKGLDFNMNYVIFEGGIPDHEFIIESKTLNTSGLKAHFQSFYPKNSWVMTESLGNYKENMLKMFGPIKSNFFKLFQKSVPFSPIMNIKQFLTEYVSDIQEKIEVEYLRDNIRHYKKLERELIKTKKKIKFLEEIEDLYRIFNDLREKEYLEQYIINRSDYEKKEAAIDKNIIVTNDARKAIEVSSNRVAYLDEENKNLYVRERQLIEENSAKNNYWENLQLMLNDAEKEMNSGTHAITKVEQIIGGTIQKWIILLREIESLQSFESLSSMKESLGLLNEAYIDIPWDFNYEILIQVKSSMRKVLEELRYKIHNNNSLINTIKDEEQEIRKQLNFLRKGIHAYPNPKIELLKSLIKKELESKYEKPIDVYVFCELIEISNVKWKDAIEGYLNHQKFYLIVNPEYFTEAIKIYDHVKFEHQIYNIGIVDIEKILEKNPEAVKGSLAEEVLTEHTYARAFANYLLGKVMKVERVEQLRKYSRAITPSCMLYQGYVVRQINPNLYKTPYIGRNSIVIRIQQCEGNLLKIQSDLANLNKSQETWIRLSDREPLSDNDISSLLGDDQNKGYVATGNEFEEREQNYFLVKSKIEKFDSSSIEKYQEELKHLSVQIKKNNDSITSENVNIAVKEEKIKRLGLETAELLTEIDDDKKALQEYHGEEWIQQVGDKEYKALKLKFGTPYKIKDTYIKNNYNTLIEKEKAFQAVVGKRREYMDENKGCSLDLFSKSNDGWKNELCELNNSSLVNYQEEIQDAKKKALQIFQEDFINKLKSNIEAIQEQINDLNRAIQNAPFGRSKYYFEVKPSKQYKAYYEMIMDEMLMEGYSLFSEDFNNRHGEVVEDLFQRIMETGEDSFSIEQLQKLEENLALFMDCRTYLDFDLIEKEGKNESRLSKDIGSKSGGETQTPFYIAVLASFLQTYKVNSIAYNNTPRLIVFDEAFSKMDHQRISEAIKLVRKMGLQLIISAPTEKIAEISPLVDRNLIVVRVNGQTVVRGFDPKELTEGEEDK